METTVIALYNRICVPRLFRYADEGHWDLIPRRAQRHPKEAKFIHKYVPNDTALHRLVRPFAAQEPCAEGTKICFSKQQQQQQQHDRSSCRNSKTRPRQNARETSLSIKCDDTGSASNISIDSSACPPETLSDMPLEQDPQAAEWLIRAVEVLLEVNPSAATTRNRFGRAPLHIACRQSNLNNNVARKQVILLLLKRAPHVASWVDLDGKTPLYHLMEHNVRKHNHTKEYTNNSFPQQNNYGVPEELLAAFVAADARAISRVKTACNKINPELSRTFLRCFAKTQKVS